MAGNCSTRYESTVSCSSKLRKILFNYQWTVENFVDFLHRKYEIPSQDFCPDPKDGSVWKLVLVTKHLYPKGPHLAVRLVKQSKDNKSYGVKYTICIVTDFSPNHGMQAREKIFNHFLDFDDCIVMSYADLVIQELLKDPQRPSLIIRCQMNILQVENASVDSTDINLPSRRISVANNLSPPVSYPTDDCDNIQDSLNALSDDFQFLYMSKQLTDFTVVVEGKLMHVHKVILAARSDFFRTTGDRICISGISSAAMEAVLLYMYTGKTRHSTVRFALEMLRAAKRFRLQRLHQLIVDFLKTSIDVENVTDVLQIADELKLEDLKRICLKFMVKNHREVQLTEKWKVLLQKDGGETLDLVKLLWEYS